MLPAQTYVKGFLRSYADYLGLDGQLYVDEFNSRYVRGRLEEEEEQTPGRGSRLQPRRIPRQGRPVDDRPHRGLNGLRLRQWMWGFRQRRR